MRGLALCLSLVALGASAQLRFEGAGTAGFETDSATRLKSASIEGTAVARLRLEYAFDDRLSLSAELIEQLSNESAVQVHDLGSMLTLRYSPWCWAPGDGFFFDFAPFDWSRIRPAFDFANAWGAPLGATGMVPTFRLRFRQSRYSAWVALRGREIPDPGGSRLALTGLGGTSVALPNAVTLEAAFETDDRAGEGNTTIRSTGGSARVHWELNGGVQQQLDLVTYRGDPERFERFNLPERYDQSIAAWLGVEGGLMAQDLADPFTPTLMREVVTGYLDVQARLRIANTRIFALFRYHPADFTRFDFPNPGFQAPFDAETQHAGELLSLGADHHLTPWLTLGAAAFVRWPAWIRQPLGYVELVGDTDVTLDAPTHVKPAWGARALAKADPFDRFSMLAELDYLHDPLQRVRTSLQQVKVQGVDGVSFQLFAQVRF